MAEVWAARHVVTQREFAIKLILPSLAGNSEAVERFLQEAKAAGRVRHPSIVDVFDVGRTPEGRPYLVMELLRGESLEARIARNRRLSVLETSILLSQVARGLHLAHRAGVVHRDLSTANVFLVDSVDGGEPLPKILDFGVSKILTPGMDGRVRTGNGAVLGSPAYMSPEQARGAETVDERTDVWALGVLAYECVTGNPPFAANNYNALMVAIISQPHRPLGEVAPSIDEALARSVESCLVKDREARTQTALELAEQLEAVARRIAGARGRSTRGPQRRATDRLPDTARSARGSRALQGAQLPAGTFPVGVRCWQFLARSTPPSGLMVGGALGGTAIGLAIGVAIATAQPADAPSATPARAATETPRQSSASPLEPPVRTAVEAPAHSAAPTDLVTATARALGVEPKKPKRRAVAPKAPARPASGSVVASVPRKNPY